MKPKRSLTEDEQQFVKDADAGGFTVDYDEHGAPFAVGATRTGNLFEGDVEEREDRDGSGSTYFLRDSSARKR